MCLPVGVSDEEVVKVKNSSRLISRGVTASFSDSPFHVQNSFSPVSSIIPWHLGQVRLSQILILSLPHCKHNRPTSLLYDGATSAMIPPTTMFWMVLQSGQDIAVIC